MFGVKQEIKLLIYLGTVSRIVLLLTSWLLMMTLLHTFASLYTPGLQEGKLKLSPPHGCPSRIYKLMLRCWASSPKDRVSFSEIVTALSDLPSESKV